MPGFVISGPVSFDHSVQVRLCQMLAVVISIIFTPLCRATANCDCSSRTEIHDNTCPGGSAGTGTGQASCVPSQPGACPDATDPPPVEDNISVYAAGDSISLSTITGPAVVPQSTPRTYSVAASDTDRHAILRKRVEVDNRTDCTTKTTTTYTFQNDASPPTDTVTVKWTGAGGSATGTSVSLTFNTIGANLTATATADDGRSPPDPVTGEIIDCRYDTPVPKSKSVTSVGVNRIEWQKPDDTWEVGPALATINNSVTIKAIPDPTSSSFPDKVSGEPGWPDWSVTSKPTGASLTSNDFDDADGNPIISVPGGRLDVVGIYTIQAKSGTSTRSIALDISGEMKITNKASILYYYPNEIYLSDYGSIAPKATAISGNEPDVAWWTVASGTAWLFPEGPHKLTCRVQTPIQLNWSEVFTVEVGIEGQSDASDSAKCKVINVAAVMAGQTEDDFVLNGIDATLVPTILALGNYALLNESVSNSSHPDPFAHVYWMALVAADRDLGVAIAEQWGNAHEKKSLTGGSGIIAGIDARDTGQDLHNNAIGRGIGSGHQSANGIWTDSQLRQAILADVQAAVGNGIDPRHTLDPDVPSGTVRLW